MEDIQNLRNSGLLTADDTIVVIQRRYPQFKASALEHLVRAVYEEEATAASMKELREENEVLLQRLVDMDEQSVDNVQEVQAPRRVVESENGRWQQKFAVRHEVVSAEEIQRITERIQEGELVPPNGDRNWWTTGGHAPTDEVPQRIIALGGGYIKRGQDNMKERYVAMYGNTFPRGRRFIDYTRELIKQGILVPVE